MNVTTTKMGEISPSNAGLGLGWLLLLAIPGLLAYYWNTTHGTLKTGEPPLVPYYLPWLGHGISFMNDINGFVVWVRSVQNSFPRDINQIPQQILY